MHPDTVMYVRQSWKEVEAIAPQASALFYDNLFIADPSLVPLFESNMKGDMEKQGDKLMKMIGITVKELSNPAAHAITETHDLARHHSAQVECAGRVCQVEWVECARRRVEGTR